MYNGLGLQSVNVKPVSWTCAGGVHEGLGPTATLRKTTSVHVPILRVHGARGTLNTKRSFVMEGPSSNAASLSKTQSAIQVSVAAVLGDAVVYLIPLLATTPPAQRKYRRYL